MPPRLRFLPRRFELFRDPYRSRHNRAHIINNERREFPTYHPQQDERRYFPDISARAANELEVCAGEEVGADSGEEIGGRVKSANGFVVCPDGFETGFVESGVGFAKVVVVFVGWDLGVFGGEVEGWGVGCRGGIESCGGGELLGDGLEGDWSFG